MMTRKGHDDRWIGIVADAGGASVFVARGRSAPALLARRWIAFDLDTPDDALAVGLRAFAREHGAARLPAYAAFAGSGTLAQRLTLPMMRTALLRAAVNTRFAQYSGGRAFYTDVQILRREGAERRVHALAAGVEQRLAHCVRRAARRAGLRLRAMTALAALFPAPRAESVVAQIIIEERAATVQLFENGERTAVRDVLIGRRDFVAAYSRPILTDRGPITLSTAQAEALLVDVGVPVGRAAELRPGIVASQVWPLLSPVLQRLQHELAHTLEHAAGGADGPVRLRVRALPTIAGVGEALEAALERVVVDPQTPPSDSDYLADFAGPLWRGAVPDLRPPAERLAERLAGPAVAAAVCAGAVLLANYAEPQRAAARMAADAPALAALRAQAGVVEQWRDAAQRADMELQRRLRAARLFRDLQPRAHPVVPLLRGVLASTPAGCMLTDVSFSDASAGAGFVLRGSYQGTSPASVVVDRWMRQLNAAGVWADAVVAAIDGSGQPGPATFEIHLRLR
ncbi:MAG: hypothetical protein AB7Q17_13220 [Phycisphaerae bacterium]